MARVGFRVRLKVFPPGEPDSLRTYDGTPFPRADRRRNAILNAFRAVSRGPGGKDSAQRRPILAFAVSVAAGILILIDGFAVTYVREINFTGPQDIEAVLATIGYAQSVVVLVAAIMLLLVPRRHGSLGYLIIVFSGASILVGAGFYLGLVLGIVGGLLGVTWKPPAMVRQPRVPTALGWRPQTANDRVPNHEMVPPADEETVQPSGEAPPKWDR